MWLRILQSELVSRGVASIPDPLIKRRQVPETVDAAVTGFDFDFRCPINPRDTLDHGQRMRRRCVNSIQARRRVELCTHEADHASLDPYIVMANDH
jgi:hypothetical protein